jgi:hypothetical protein
MIKNNGAFDAQNDDHSEEFPIEEIVEALRNLNNEDINPTEHAKRLEALNKRYGAERVQEAIDRLKRETESFYRPISTVDFPHDARPEAFHGIAGKITQAICKESELKPEAVLAQFLCIFGNMLGRGLYKWQEARHGTLVNVAIVGNTGDGAKGGSLRALKNLFSVATPNYFATKFTKGHNSSEAILEEIRDEVLGKDENGNEVAKEEEVTDKRLLIVEEELSRIFEVGKRDGCNISEFLR